MDRVGKNPRHKRRHSWPPVRLTKKRPTQQKTIDENPFAFFISPPEESRGYLFDHVDAGIEQAPLQPLHSNKVKARKPLHRWRQRAQAQKAVTKLKFWIKRMEKFYRHEPLPKIAEIVPPPTLLAEQIGLPAALRGPFQDDTFETAPPVQRRIRSHSARPRSWIDPPADLWTVSEENEEEVTRSLGHSVPALPRRRLYS